VDLQMGVDPQMEVDSHEGPPRGGGGGFSVGGTCVSFGVP
jgi:hypothetical protein